jgi:DNA (cytosine-5)-methyltransferase 1
LSVPAYQYEFWPEAEIVAEPVKRPGEPQVLVRRRTSPIVDWMGNDVAYLPGLPAISLFTGAGGMDIGMERAGFCTLVQHEWDSSACQTLMANRPQYFRHAALIQGDLRLTPTSMLLREAGLRVGDAAVVCGGPPCQGFSTANKHSGKGTYDTRNDLVFEYLRVVREAMPRFFIMENVAGFLSFPGELNGKSYLQTFLEAAYGSYYEIVYGLLDAVNYGVPQYRCRFIAMGTRRDVFEVEGMLGSLPAPITFAEPDLSLIHNPVSEQDRQSALLLRNAPGVRYFPDRPVLVPPRPVHDGQISAKYLEFYSNLRATEPDRIVASPQGAQDEQELTVAIAGLQ